jgi:AcrR family transcriptional regulator
MTLRTTSGERHTTTTRRSRALDAAAELLETRGLAGLTTDAVAERVGTSTYVVERLWPSDEALALDTLRQMWLELAAQVYGGACRLGVR